MAPRGSHEAAALACYNASRTPAFTLFAYFPCKWLINTASFCCQQVGGGLRAARPPRPQGVGLLGTPPEPRRRIGCTRDGFSSHRVCERQAALLVRRDGRVIAPVVDTCQRPR